MTTEQIKIAVAEELGWTNIVSSSFYKEELYGTNHDPEIGRTLIPDYPSSLDACREFEDRITEWRNYASILQDVCGIHCVGVVPDYPEDLLKLFCLITATPLQRCKSFLRLRGRWIETPTD